MPGIGIAIDLESGLGSGSEVVEDGGGTPNNVLTFNGEPITFNGEPLTFGAA